MEIVDFDGTSLEPFLGGLWLFWPQILTSEILLMYVNI